MSKVPVQLTAKGSPTRVGPDAPSVRPLTAPVQFHVLAKPSGPICNLDCEYCFFLSKEALYPGDRFRMSEDLLRTYLRQLIESHSMAPEVTVAWQGGEPTLMGVEFFQHAVDIANEYARRGQTISHTIQTNGTLLTEEWAAMLKKNNFLVGISIDGPPDVHDRYRVDKKGRPSSERVLRGLEMLKAAGVEWNVLCTVHPANQDRGAEVYRYFRDELGANFIQYIPIVELDNESGFQSGELVTERSVDPEAWGRFLIDVFEEWVHRDVGTVYVSQFDAALASWYGAPASLCIFAETCGDAVALEHNGDLYSCDHYVEPDYLLGNIFDTHMVELLGSSRQRNFGLAKRDGLPQYCRDCTVRFACNGECPKNRIRLTPQGEAGLNYLCAGYFSFFTRIDPAMKFMAARLRNGGYADQIMDEISRAARNEPCPCGSGRKVKNCRPAVASAS